MKYAKIRRYLNPEYGDSWIAVSCQRDGRLGPDDGTFAHEIFDLSLPAADAMAQARQRLERRLKADGWTILPYWTEAQ